MIGISQSRFTLAFDGDADTLIEYTEAMAIAIDDELDSLDLGDSLAFWERYYRARYTAYDKAIDFTVREFTLTLSLQQDGFTWQ